MSYISYFNFKEFLKDIAGYILAFFKWLALTIIKIARFVVYAISSLGVVIFGIAFPAGIYFCYRVFAEMINGVPLTETTYFGFFLLFFVAPLVFGIVREIV